MIQARLMCNECNAVGPGTYYNPKTKFAQTLRRIAKAGGWSLTKGRDLCTTCTQHNQKGGNMKDPKAWRRAVLNRAVEKDTTPETVLAEFFPHINDPPRTIEPSEAQELASRYPFDAEEITEAFTRPLC